MEGLSAWAVAVGALVTGGVVGFAARRARLCSFGAIESALIGADWRGMKVFGLALGIAILGTQGLVAAGMLDPTATTYVPERVPIVSVAIGSVLFGLGIAQVGTCAFGSILRCASGDLRALVVLLVFGAVAFATLRGILSTPRLVLLEPLSLTMPGPVAGGLGALLDRVSVPGLAWAAGLAAAAGLIGLAAADGRLRRSRRMVGAGIVLGLGIVAGWVLTGPAADPFDATRPQSLTFVAPVARTLYAGLVGAAEWSDFGVASVLGVFIGGHLAARAADELRWEAFDDHVEMRRHIGGAVAMGVGGILAGGCTIGQGLTAGSLLAVTWPVAVLGMLVGARLGLAILQEGSLMAAIAARRGRTPG